MEDVKTRTNPNLLALKGWPIRLPRGRHRRPTLPTWDSVRSVLIMAALMAIAIPVGIALGLGLLAALVALVEGV